MQLKNKSKGQTCVSENRIIESKESNCHHEDRRFGQSLELGGGHMKESLFVRADEIAADLDVSNNYAYKLIKIMNAELEEEGYLVVPGRVSRKYYKERFYSLSRPK